MAKNGNITGQVFDDGVIKQIETRQKFLGARYPTDKHLIYQNNQTSFIRLASSVNVGAIPDSNFKYKSKEEFAQLNAIQQEEYLNLQQQQFTFLGGFNQLKDRNINVTLTGDKLAKACVLFGGTVGVDDNLNPLTKFGLYNSNEDPILTIAAYGWGGVGSRGYVPMPSIDSANIGFYNRGALQKADVKIKVYSLEQLQIFDLLYFRIGYTMLLEWGHNIWVNNDEELINRTEFVTEPFQNFFSPSSTQNDIIKAIQNQRKNDDYNYDAMLGKVTNFTWKFNADGSYDINLKLIGLGDIIESLKVNKSAIITGKAETTPSQELNQRDQNVKALEDKAAEDEANANKEEEEAKAALQDKIKKANDEIAKLVNEFKRLAAKLPTSDTGKYTSMDSEAVEVVKQYRSNFQNFFVGQVSDDKENNDSIIEQTTTTFNDIGTFEDDFMAAEGYNDNTDLWNKMSNDAVGRMKTIVRTEIDDWVKTITDSDIQKVDRAASRTEENKSAAEKLKEAAQRARQAVEKEKEIRSLSPLTSIETKNKSLFNQQLYAWRKEAESGRNASNTYKMKMTANSASPDSTGTTTLSLDFYYIRLGHVLDWMQNNLLIYDKTKDTTNAALELDIDKPFDQITEADVAQMSNAQKAAYNKLKAAPKGTPMFTIDTNPEANLCLSYPGQISSDPTSCLIPSKYTSPDGTITWNVLKDLEQKSPYYVSDNPYAGKLMNIMINIDKTAAILDNNIDANGKVNLQKFLVALLNEINDALGNVNKMEPVFDTEHNKLIILEGSSVDGAADVIKEKEKELNKMAVFNVYGIGSDSEPNGSFMTDVDFQVQLPPNMAAMATISAQANGNIVGENATGLSKLNVGLTDRLITTKLDRDSIEGSKSGNESPEVLFNKNLTAVKTIITDLYVNKKYAKDSVSSARSMNRDIALYLTGNESMTDKMPAPFFIPFNLSLNMMGLAGMKNYERFSITEDVLPYSYRAAEQGGIINFLIKGLSHKIDNNKWETKIESLSVGAKREKL